MVKPSPGQLVCAVSRLHHIGKCFVSAEREFDAVTPRRRVEETIRVLVALVVSKVLMAKTARRKSEGQQVGVRE